MQNGAMFDQIWSNFILFNLHIIWWCSWKYMSRYKKCTFWQHVIQSWGRKVSPPTNLSAGTVAPLPPFSYAHVGTIAVPLRLAVKISNEQPRDARRSDVCETSIDSILPMGRVKFHSLSSEFNFCLIVCYEQYWLINSWLQGIFLLEITVII